MCLYILFFNPLRVSCVHHVFPKIRIFSYVTTLLSSTSFYYNMDEIMLSHLLSISQFLPVDLIMSFMSFFSSNLKSSLVSGIAFSCHVSLVSFIWNKLTSQHNHTHIHSKRHSSWFRQCIWIIHFLNKFCQGIPAKWLSQSCPLQLSSLLSPLALELQATQSLFGWQVWLCPPKAFSPWP